MFRERVKSTYSLNGDSLIQLIDGRIISYYFRKFEDLSIYNPDNLKKFFQLN